MFNPEMTYRFEHKVTFYECDLGLRMKPSALLRVLQQGGENQLVDMGLGYETLRDKYSMAFLVSRMIMDIDRMPQNNETFTVETCPMGAAGSQFFRQANAVDGEGNVMVRLYTSWTLYDPAAHKVLRPKQFPVELPGGELEIDTKEFKLKIERGEAVGKRPVVYSDLDSNGHMNNAIYFDVICDMLPLEELKQASPRRIRLVYDQQALPGTDLELYCDASVQGEYRLTGMQQDHRCFEAEVIFPGNQQ